MNEPPKIQTIEGVGADFLVWARETILELERRVAELEAVASASKDSQAGE